MPFFAPRDIIEVSVTKSHPRQDAGLRIDKLKHGRFVIKEVSGLFQRVPNVNIRAGDRIIQLNGVPVKRYSSVSDMMRSISERNTVTIALQRTNQPVSSSSETSSTSSGSGYDDYGRVHPGTGVKKNSYNQKGENYYDRGGDLIHMTVMKSHPRQDIGLRVEVREGKYYVLQSSGLFHQYQQNQKVSIEKGDKILQLNGIPTKKFSSVEDIMDYISEQPTISIVVDRTAPYPPRSHHHTGNRVESPTSSNFSTNSSTDAYPAADTGNNVYGSRFSDAGSSVAGSIHSNPRPSRFSDDDSSRGESRLNKPPGSRFSYDDSSRGERSSHKKPSGSRFSYDDSSRGESSHKKPYGSRFSYDDSSRGESSHKKPYGSRFSDDESSRQESSHKKPYGSRFSDDESSQGASNYNQHNASRFSEDDDDRFSVSVSSEEESLGDSSVSVSSYGGSINSDPYESRFSDDGSRDISMEEAPKRFKHGQENHGDCVHVTLTKSFPKQDAGLLIKRRHGRYFIDKISGLFRRCQVQIKEGDEIVELNGVPAHRYTSAGDMMQGIRKVRTISVITTRGGHDKSPASSYASASPPASVVADSYSAESNPASLVVSVDLSTGNNRDAEYDEPIVEKPKRRQTRFDHPNGRVLLSVTKSYPREDTGLRIEDRNGRYFVKDIKGGLRKNQVPIVEGDEIIEVNGVPAEKYPSVDDVIHDIMQEGAYTILVESAGAEKDADTVSAAPTEPSAATTEPSLPSEASPSMADSLESSIPTVETPTEASSVVSEFYPGDWVRIEGSKSPFNNETVRVLKKDGPERYIVKVVNSPDGKCICTSKKRMVRCDPPPSEPVSHNHRDIVVDTIEEGDGDDLKPGALMKIQGSSSKFNGQKVQVVKKDKDSDDRYFVKLIDLEGDRTIATAKRRLVPYQAPEEEVPVPEVTPESPKQPKKRIPKKQPPPKKHPVAERLNKPIRKQTKPQRNENPAYDEIRPVHNPGDIIRASVTKGSKRDYAGLHIRQEHGKYYVKDVVGLFRQFQLPVAKGDEILQLNDVPAKRYKSVGDMYKSIKDAKKVTVVVQRGFKAQASDSTTSGYNDDDPDNIGYEFHVISRGDIMMINGLSRRAEWNGHLVRVLEEDDVPGRWLVQLANDPEEVISVAAARLEPISQNEQAHHLSYEPLPPLRQKQQELESKKVYIPAKYNQPPRKYNQPPRKYNQPPRKHNQPEIRKQHKAQAAPPTPTGRPPVKKPGGKPGFTPKYITGILRGEVMRVHGLKASKHLNGQNVKVLAADSKFQDRWYVKLIQTQEIISVHTRNLLSVQDMSPKRQ